MEDHELATLSDDELLHVSGGGLFEAWARSADQFVATTAGAAVTLAGTSYQAIEDFGSPVLTWLFS
jgi:hypothetical protein